ncbi:MAG: ATP-binding cassette domain-containing protein [Dermatophilaceae bacterium]
MTPDLAVPIPPPSGRLFIVRDLTKTYGEGDAAVHALAGVDLDLHAGELIVLLGPSGSGKTTLLNQLGGLDIPTVRRRCATATSTSRTPTRTQLTRYRRESVGFIFQFYNLIPSLTARENVGLITEIAPRPADARGRAAAWSGSRRAHGPFSRPALRRRAAARRHRPRHRQAPRGPALRRTHRRARRARPASSSSRPSERANRELGTLTVIITHNAVMADMADRVIRFSDGRVQSESHNPHPAAPDTLQR